MRCCRCPRTSGSPAAALSRALFATGAGAGRPAVELADMPLSGTLLAVEVEVPGVAAFPLDPEVSAS